MEDHPEAKKLLADFISSALAEQPADVFEFASAHFKGTATVVEEPPDPADAAEADDAQGVDDQDDLDDLDEMAASTNPQLKAYLQEVFMSMDVDSSGTISKNELQAKLAVRRALAHSPCSRRLPLARPHVLTR